MARTVFVRGVGLGLAIVMALSSTVVAATKTVSVLNVWGTMGVWGSYADFYAEWKATRTTSEGRTYWLIENLDMDVLLENGKNCTVDICTDWDFAATARYYNSSGTLVATITPPLGNCYPISYPSTTRSFTRCKLYGTEVPSSAATVKYNWTLSVKRRDGVWLQAWTASKTVTLANT